MTARIEASGGQPQLKRTLGLWQVTLSGVGIVIGAGIYVLIGSAAEEAGNALWLAFVIAAVMSALTGLSYAELASMFPAASAEYEFARQAFNEFVAFITGWAMVLANVIAAAAVSIGFGHYLAHFVDVDVRVSSACLLAVLTLVSISGIERSVWLTVLLALVEISGLVLVIVAGAPHVGEQDLLAGGSVTSVLGASALVFFAFIGFDEVVTLSEETQNPSRTIPRALLLALGISTLLYVLVGISAVSVLGGDGLAASAQPLTQVMEHNWGASAGDIVAVIALASTTNTSLLVMIAGSRVIYGMAQRGALPRVFATVNQRARTPHLAAVGVLVLALPFVAPGEIDFAASLTDLTIYAVFILVNLAVIILRRRRPDLPRSFRAPGRIGNLPLTPVLGLVTVVGLALFLDWQTWLFGSLCLLPGVILWYALSKQRSAVP
ncbi:MAG TPA: APC family permease [Dehalococcoidia bacterium]|nr:APC family permease [Dehalococcoidia bacterium]